MNDEDDDDDDDDDDDLAGREPLRAVRAERVEARCDARAARASSPPSASWRTAGRRDTTQTVTASPSSACSSANATHSAMAAGWASTTSSTSSGETISPPRLMTFIERSVR